MWETIRKSKTLETKDLSLEEDIETDSGKKNVSRPKEKEKHEKVISKTKESDTEESIQSVSVDEKQTKNADLISTELSLHVGWLY